MRITVYVVDTPAGYLGYNGSLVAGPTNATKYSLRQSLRVASQTAGGTALKWYNGVVKPLSAYEAQKGS